MSGPHLNASEIERTLDMMETSAQTATHQHARGNKNSVKDGPLVSILMPSFNHEAFVGAAIDSVWGQSYQNIELIIIDDCSRDHTVQVIEDRLKSAPIPASFSKNLTNSGPAASLNRALLQAKGEWVCFLASDDFYDPDFIAISLETASKQEGPVVIHCDGYLVDTKGKMLDRIYESSLLPPASGDAFMSLAFGESRVVALSVFMRRASLIEAGLFDESLGSEDYDLHLRLAVTHKFVFVPKPLVSSRRVPGSLGSTPSKWMGDGIKILAKHRERLGTSYTLAMLRKYERNAGAALHSQDFLTAVAQIRLALNKCGFFDGLGVALRFLASFAIAILKLGFNLIGVTKKPRGVKQIINRIIIR
jgi:glycosyltransferase involved in cell wall biosynthesis